MDPITLAEEKEWYIAWKRWSDDAKRDGFTLIHLEPGEMAVAYHPMTQSTSTRVVATRISPLRATS